MGLKLIKIKKFVSEKNSSDYNIVSIPQPFATMITSGIIKSWNSINIRKFKKGDNIIVYAKPSTEASYKELWNDEYYSSHFVNASHMGEIPDKMPVNSYIGTIRIDWVGRDGTRYVDKSGIFINPLEGIPVKNTFELQVPTEKKIELVDRTLRVPLSKELWSKLNEHKGQASFSWMQYFNAFYSEHYGFGDKQGRYDVVFYCDGNQKRLSQEDDQAVKKENYELLPEHHKFLALVFHFEKLGEPKNTIQQYYESLTSSLLEETREIIAKHYPNYQTLLNYVLEGYTPDFSEYTDSQMIISQLEDVCTELENYYNESTEPQVNLESLGVQETGHDTFPSSENDKVITKDASNDEESDLKENANNEHDSVFTEQMPSKDNGILTEKDQVNTKPDNKVEISSSITFEDEETKKANENKKIDYQKELDNKVCYDSTNILGFSSDDIGKMSFKELISAIAMYLFPNKKNKREIYEYRFQDPRFLKPWLRGERSLSNFAKHFCDGETLNIASIIFDKVLCWYKSNYTAKVLRYSKSMSQLLERAYGLKNSYLSSDIQNILISSCTSEDVLDKVSHNEVTVDDLLLICNKDEFLKIRDFLNFHYKQQSVKLYGEPHNDGGISEDKPEKQTTSLAIKASNLSEGLDDISNKEISTKRKAKRTDIKYVSQLDEYGQMAAKLVREGNNLFITGKAGTGKSTVLKVLVQDAKDRKKDVVVLAPTGVAAKVAKGMTIHSFLHLPLGPYIPGHRIQGLYHLNDIESEVIRKLDIIFIDEVSMVRCDLLDEIDDVLRHYRENESPFGGIQIVMFGDLYQLMPVADDEDKEKLSKAYKTKSLYFFEAKVYNDMNCKTFELMKIYRQAENDFKDLLNDVREGSVAPYEIKKLESRYRKGFSPSDKEGYIRITTHNYRANKYNRERLENLSGEVYDFKASIPKGFIPKEEWPTDYHLRLKKGARVMFLRNDPDKRFVNGTLGTVTRLTDYSICVTTDEGLDIDVDKCNWDFYKYKINKLTKEIESELVGTFRQYPLRLAWAVTIHKSQGMQFSKVIIDAGHAFAYGQVYVALSRCEVFHNIFLVSKITAKIIQTDPVVKDFMRKTPRISVEGKIENGEGQEHHHLSFDPLEDTLWMIKDGLTLDQILAQSNEPAGIIYGRLIKLIKQGDVDIMKLLSTEKYKAIKSAFDKLGSTAALKRIKTMCPECNFGEINLVKASFEIET